MIEKVVINTVSLNSHTNSKDSRSIFNFNHEINQPKQGGIMKPTIVLEDHDIRETAPSVFADQAWAENSQNYRFLPTISVVNALRDSGYNVVKAIQSRCRIEGKGDFTKHMIRLRHSTHTNPLNIGDEVPEIVLVNSHDRSSAFKLMLGIFRLVCSNGMVVASQKIESLSVRHTGSDNLLNEVIDVTAEIINEAPKAIDQIHRFKGIILTPDEQVAFASGAKELLTTSIDIKPERLLNVRRYDDYGSPDGSRDIWKTFNVVQENMIRGGVRGVNANNRLMRTREVKSVQADININKALWKYTEEIARLKSKE
jgi:hypothetical protein